MVTHFRKSIEHSPDSNSGESWKMDWRRNRVVNLGQRLLHLFLHVKTPFGVSDLAIETTVLYQLIFGVWLNKPLVSIKVETVEIYTTDTTVARWFHPQDLRSSWSRHLHTASRFTLDLVLRWLRKPWAADAVMEVFNMEMLPIRVLMYLDNVPISSYIYILCTIY